MMKRLLLVLAALWLAAPVPSHAQSVTKLCFPATGLTATRTSCVPVDSSNPLPTTATLSAAGGINVTVTNTTGSPVQVSNPNGFGGTISGTLTVQNLSAGSNLNVLETNSAAILSAVQASIPAGTFAIGTVTIQNTPSAQVYNQIVPGTTNGWLTALLNGLTTTVTTVKSTAGKVAKLYCYNPNSSVAYVQVFNATPSSVTLGTTTPASSYGIGATSIGGFGSNIGDGFSSAISVAATTTVKGLTAPSTALDCNVSYN
jgi:hypothetical protein